jgi:hypothetical protein
VLLAPLPFPDGRLETLLQGEAPLLHFVRRLHNLLAHPAQLAWETRFRPTLDALQMCPCLAYKEITVAGQLKGCGGALGGSDLARGADERGCRGGGAACLATSSEEGAHGVVVS